MTDDISLTGRLLLFSIDPGRGGMLDVHDRRFRRALVAAHRGGGRPLLWHARTARRAAQRELEAAGLLERGRLRLADRARTMQLFNGLWRRIERDELDDPGDRELVVLLAWTGVLRRRLVKDERQLALRRIRRIVSEPPRRGQLVPDPNAFPAPMTQGTLAVGAIAALGASDLLADLSSGDLGGADFGGADFGGAFVGGGGDGGGGGEGGGQ
jgi:uncharacterized membrane protein YgcG